MSAAEWQLEERHPDEPFAHLAWHAVAARRKGNDEFVTRAMHRVIDEDTARIKSGLTMLASIDSKARGTARRISRGLAEGKCGHVGLHRTGHWQGAAPDRFAEREHG
jgi:hypothetical protein